MKKIIYVSSEAFFDVDFPILKELNNQFDLIWIPIIRTDDGWYSEEEIEYFCRNNNIKNITILQTVKYKNPKIILLYLRLLNTIRSLHADVIYFEYFGVPILHLLTPLYLNVKNIVFAIHDVEQHYKMEYGKLKTLYFEYIIKRFRHFQVFSESQLTLFRKKYPNKEVVSANLYLKDFGKATQTRNEDKINFIFFGIIRKNKGLDILIESFNRIGLHRDDFTVTVAGDAKYWEYYKELIKDESHYNLIIRKIDNSEIANLLVGAHYIILPYLDVTQSGVLLTAYNYCLPAIASDLEGFREYISDGYNGFLVEPNKVEALEEKLVYILNNHKNIYSDLIGNLQKYIEKNINLETIVNNYVNFLNKI
ncbi:glycosyltransferase family 4 protein [Sphingobacterium multivorum]|uniref:glycosyltransferase family 4 protein n=1 Tax=Sphingobacterium multivorum TaxID=28454 RepID=UPI003DA56C5C